MKTTFNFRLLQTSDVHGYLYPKSYATKKFTNIGLAQVSTLIEKYRTKNTILIDTGDTIQGSPLTYHHSKESASKQHPMSKIFNYLKYDYITLGNHEFNYGNENLNNFANYLDAKILNSNLLNIKTNKPIFGKEYEIINYKNGPKIAIIGATTHYIPNWEQPSHIEHIKFIDAFEAIKKNVSIVKETENPDFIIVNYHGGFERDLETHLESTEDTGENQGFKIIKEIDGIDLLLTGHQHRTLAGKLFDSFYIQPSFNGTGLGYFNVDFTYKKNKWSFEVKNIEVLNTTDIAVDNSLLELVNEDEEKTQIFLDTPIGISKKDFLIKDQLEARINKHPLITLINQVQLQYSKADISSCSLGNNVSGFKKDITIRDVLSTYLFTNTLVVKKVKGDILLKALEKTAEFFEINNGLVVISDKFNTPKLQLYAYDMYDNIDYTIDLREPHGKRIKNVLFKDEPLKIDKYYSVVMNNYRATGGGEYLFFRDCKTLKDIQVDVIELLINYIYNKKNIKIDEINNINIIY